MKQGCTALALCLGIQLAPAVGALQHAEQCRSSCCACSRREYNLPVALCSDDTARLIDGEVRALVDAAYQRTVKVGNSSIWCCLAACGHAASRA